METKVCSACEKEKSVNKFYANKMLTSGVENQCKRCRIVKMKNRGRTLTGKMKNIYRDQVAKSRIRGHAKPSYSKIDFMNWCLGSFEFTDLYGDWVKSGYSTDLAPSIDRLDESVGYSFDNIQVLTWKENSVKACEYRRNCKGTGIYRSVVKLSLEYDLLATYPSYAMAGREAGLHAENIGRACRNNKYTSGGFKWMYEEDYNNLINGVTQ